MVNVTYRKFGLGINHVWFCEDAAAAVEKSRADIVFLHGLEDMGGFGRGAVILRQATLVTDLTVEEAALYDRIEKKTRRQVDRARREGVTCRLFHSKTLMENPALLRDFAGEYNAFARAKGFRGIFNGPLARRYAEAGHLLLTRAADADGRVLAQHVYVVDGKTARGLYSVAHIRPGEARSQLVGRANRYLHWTEIQHLRSGGFSVLDWGGLFNPAAPEGVDRFKMAFGGSVVTRHNVLAGTSGPGRLALRLLRGYRGLKGEPGELA